MAKKQQIAPDSYGPFYETYIKVGADGIAYEHDVPVYHEVKTEYGTFGVPKGKKLTFKLVDDELVTVFSDTGAKPRKPKKVTPDKPVASTEE